MILRKAVDKKSPRQGELVVPAGKLRWQAQGPYDDRQRQRGGKSSIKLQETARKSKGGTVGDESAFTDS